MTIAGGLGYVYAKQCAKIVYLYTDILPPHLLTALCQVMIINNNSEEHTQKDEATNVDGGRMVSICGRITNGKNQKMKLKI